MNNELFEKYSVYELVYEEKMKKKCNKKFIYPFNWYREKNYEDKIIILDEAIKNNILIVETSAYKKYIGD